MSPLNEPARWINLDGANNARDLGGLPAGPGRWIQPGRLIRSDNLQDLTTRDVAVLVERVGVRSVVDLRGADEVSATGPGPLDSVADVTVHHLSVFSADTLGVTRRARSGAVARSSLATCGTGRCPVGCRAAPYRRYLRRADSILAALRIIAEPDGATIVHCAAGKDRTGVVIALALTLLEVPQDLVVADYMHSAERAELVEHRLAGTGLYRAGRSPDQYTLVRATMECFLSGLRRDHDGARGWLAGSGWTEGETSRLARSLTHPHP